MGINLFAACDFFLTHLLRKAYEKDSTGIHHLHGRAGFSWVGKIPLLLSFVQFYITPFFWPSADHGLCSVCPSRPANSAVVSLAFGRYMLEPFFAPCAAPVPAVKLVSLLGYCKYSPLRDRRFQSLSAPDWGHLRGVIFWDNGGIGALPPWPPKIP